MRGDRSRYSTMVDLWVPTSAVAPGAGGAVTVATYAKRDGPVRADLFPVGYEERRALQVSTTAGLLHATIDGVVADLPLYAVAYDRGARSYSAAVRTPQRAADLLPLRGHRCGSGTFGTSSGAIVALTLGLVLAPAQITPSQLLNVTIPSVELVFGIRERVQEAFAPAWDASAETRTGGTVFALTTASPPGAAEIVDVYRGAARMTAGVDYTLSGSTVTFLDGSKPIAGETVVVQYTPA